MGGSSPKIMSITLTRMSTASATIMIFFTVFSSLVFVHEQTRAGPLCAFLAVVYHSFAIAATAVAQRYLVNWFMWPVFQDFLGNFLTVSSCCFHVFLPKDISISLMCEGANKASRRGAPYL